MTRIHPYARCRQCDWDGDPKRRASVDTQAEQHTSATGHVTEVGERALGWQS